MGAIADPHFHAGETDAQARWDTTHLWTDARREQLIWDQIPEPFLERFASAPYFFLATSDADGCCDCSFKGGGTGLINLIDAKRFAFPDFDGNGAFMSIGNILRNPQVGCLFLDFQDGARLRVNGRASVHDVADRPDLVPASAEAFKGAARIIQVEIERVIPNCNRHIPLMFPIDKEVQHDK